MYIQNIRARSGYVGFIVIWKNVIGMGILYAAVRLLTTRAFI